MPRFTSSSGSRRPTPFELDPRNWLGLVLAFVVSALANSAGVGGGAFLVPLFNLVVGFSLKRSTALSQPTMAGGAIAGVLYSLLQSNPTNPNLPVVSFRLALELGPPLVLGTSLGVLINPLLPNWFIVVLLTVVLLLLAVRILTKALRMHAVETSKMQPAIEEEVDVTKAAGASPFAAQAAGDAKVKSHPVRFESRPSGGNSSPALSSAVSAADSTVWDADADEAQQPALASQRSNSGGPSSPWGGPERPAASDVHTTRPSLVRSRLAAASSAVAEPSEDDEQPETPVAQRRLTWLGILLEALLLFGLIAAFLVLEMLKARREICTWQFGLLYGIQAATCLLVSSAWISLPALLSRRAPASELQQPLLSRMESFPEADPTVGGLFAAAGVSLLGGFVAGMVGLGGGAVLSPLLLELGVHPLVGAATSVLLVACNSVSAAVQFGLEGRLPLVYAAVYAGVCALGSVAGGKAISVAVKRTGRASYVVFMLALTIFTGGLATAIVGGMRAFAELQKGLPGFHNICAA